MQPDVFSPPIACYASNSICEATDHETPRISNKTEEDRSLLEILVRLTSGVLKPLREILVSGRHSSRGRDESDKEKCVCTFQERTRGVKRVCCLCPCGLTQRQNYEQGTKAAFQQFLDLRQL